MNATDNIRMITSPQELQRHLEREVQARLNAVTYRLNTAGFEAVKAQRPIDQNRGGYADDTGNLRSSVGFKLFCNGRDVTSQDTFAQVKDGAKGVQQGKDIASEHARKFSKDGICLTLVAGMNYAGYVSATGRDVLDTARRVAKEALPQIKTDLKLK